jgi:hypothetical protein
MVRRAHPGACPPRYPATRGLGSHRRFRGPAAAAAASRGHLRAAGRHHGTVTARRRGAADAPGARALERKEECLCVCVASRRLPSPRRSAQLGSVSGGLRCSNCRRRTGKHARAGGWDGRQLLWGCCAPARRRDRRRGRPPAPGARQGGLAGLGLPVSHAGEMGSLRGCCSASCACAGSTRLRGCKDADAVPSGARGRIGRCSGCSAGLMARGRSSRNGGSAAAPLLLPCHAQTTANPLARAPLQYGAATLSLLVGHGWHCGRGIDAVHESHRDPSRASESHMKRKESHTLATRLPAAPTSQRTAAAACG